MIAEKVITDNDISYYFKCKSRSMYYVQLKKEWAKILKAKGYTLKHIAFVILHDFNRHDTICHYLNTHFDIDNANEIRENMFEWFRNKLIPLTVATKEGKSTMVLKNIDNLTIKRYKKTKNIDVNINYAICLAQMDALIGNRL